jgi:hypothetical protein
MGEVSDQRSSVFFDVNEASDERDATFEPDPTGRSRPPGVMEYFAGRNQRKMAVSNPDTDGLSFTVFTFAPGTLLPKHRHNVDYIEFVLAGEVHHGNRVLGPGQGVYRAAGTPYSFWAGPDGATIADFRAHTFYTTEYDDPPEKFPPHRL